MINRNYTDLSRETNRLKIVEYLKKNFFYVPFEMSLDSCMDSFRIRKYLFFILIYMLAVHRDAYNLRLCNLRRVYNWDTSGYYDYSNTQRGYFFVMDDFFDNIVQAKRIFYYIQEKKEYYVACKANPSTCNTRLPPENEWEFLWAEYNQILILKSTQMLYLKIGDMEMDAIYTRFQGILTLLSLQEMPQGENYREYDY